MLLDPLIPLESPTLITVVNKTTREAHYGVPDTLYSTTDWVHNPDQELIDSGYWKVSGDSIVAMTQEEKDELDAALLDAAKERRYTEIDSRTEELINQGFLFSSLVFSLSPGAQAKLMGVNQVRGNANVEYPIHWNTKDDKQTRDIEDADDMLSFYLTAVGTYRAHVDAGTVLKNQVREKTTIEEVEAVEDTR
jgi:D-alanyl-D-alanine carboxypeptidase